MSDQFPQMVYRAPGAEEIHGGKFESKVVGDRDELKAALAEGFHETTTAAKEAHEAANGETPSKPTSNKPTRDELEHKAAELGIEFSSRTSDKALGKLIEDKLAA